MRTKTNHRFYRNKMQGFNGSQAEWRKLVRGVLTPPDRDYEWHKTPQGKWIRHRA